MIARLTAAWSAFLDFCNPDRIDPAVRWSNLTHEPLDSEETP